MFLAATISGIAATAVTFGSTQHLVRTVATEREKSLAALGEVLSLCIQNTLIVYAVVNAAFRIIQPELSPVLLLVTGYDFLDQIWYAFSAFFTGHRRIRYRLAIGAIFKAVLVAAVAAAAYATRALEPVLLTYIAVEAGLLATAALAVRRLFGRIPIRFDRATSLRQMSASLPFFAFNILTILHMRLDTLMVGFMLGVVQVAYYDLGVKLLEVARFVVRPLHSVFYPIFSDLAARRRRKVLRRRAQQLIVGALALGVLGSAAMLVLADEAIAILFGRQYEASAAPARVLFLALPFVLVHYVLTTLANAIHLERLSAWLLAGSTVLNLALNVFIIPRYGIMGAAWTTVVSQLVLATSLLLVTVKRLAGREGPSGAPQGEPPEPLS